MVSGSDGGFGGGGKGEKKRLELRFMRMDGYL